MSLFNFISRGHFYLGDKGHYYLALTIKSAKAYRELWKAQQGALRRISGNYSPNTKSKAPVHTEIMAMPWDVFLARVKDDPYHGFKERCNLL